MSLGRNFSFRIPPLPDHRLGRFKTGASAIVQGAPVKSNSVDATDKRNVMALATGAQDPVKGLSGIVVWEEPWFPFDGQDRGLFRPGSDLDTVPAHTPAQVVHGDEVKVLFENTSDDTFVTTDYDGRVMVAGVGSLAVGDLLTPGTGNDTDGYWAKTTTASQGWLRVTYVDSTNGLVEAQMLF